jgi:amidase
MLAFIEKDIIMVDKTMTRRQFNKLLMAGMLISTEGLLNSRLAASSFAKSSDIGGLGSYSATSLIKVIKGKKISATELLKYFMDRHKRLDSKINAVVATDFEGALKRAQKADEALSRGEIWGPLHGLPMTIKDNIEVVGMPTTYGSPMFREYIPQKNADVVQSLLDAGAIIFGKTNIPLFGMDTQSFNDVYGQTNNPWDISKTPGGSSGGAAAALAAGLTGLEIGNDIGGSIRLPAHFCGVYGHKPSYNIVSMHGGKKPWKKSHTNYPVDLDLAVYGPIARSAEDLKLAMDIIIGPPSYQRKAIKIKLPGPRRTKLKEFRVGLWLDDSVYPPDEDIRKCLQKMVSDLTKEGIILKTEKPDVDLKRCHLLRGYLETSTLSHIQPPGYYEWAVSQAKTLQDEDQSPTARWIRAMTGSHRDWNKLNEERTIIRQKWDDYFQDIDVLLCPVARIAAHNHDHTKIGKRLIQFDEKTVNYWDVVGPWNSLSQVSYLPSTVAPIGFTPSGLPIGVQIIGPYLEDYTSIQFAMLLERMNGSYKPPQGFEL